MPTPSNSELIDGCRAGDSESWIQLVSRYESLVYAVARRNGLTKDDAADVTQTTFATLLTHFDSLRDTDSLPAWLSQVARRESWRLTRVSRREAIHPAAPDYEDPVADWERREAIEVALRRLGSPCQEALFLLFLDPSSPTQEAVAERLGRAAGGIGPLRSRCLEKLRVIIEGNAEQ
jgi:RNA polymerase sigma factor (sigma-70 family)